MEVNHKKVPVPHKLVRLTTLGYFCACSYSTPKSYKSVCRQQELNYSLFWSVRSYFSKVETAHKRAILVRRKTAPTIRDCKKKQVQHACHNFKFPDFNCIKQGDVLYCRCDPGFPYFKSSDNIFDNYYKAIQMTKSHSDMLR